MHIYIYIHITYQYISHIYIYTYIYIYNKLQSYKILVSEHRVSRNHGVITILLINAALSLAINCLAVIIQMKRTRTFPATSHHRARILQLAMFDYRRVYPKIEPHVGKYSIPGACIHMYIYIYIYICQSHEPCYSIICWRIPSRCWPYFEPRLRPWRILVPPRCPTSVLLATCVCHAMKGKGLPWLRQGAETNGHSWDFFGWMNPPPKNMVSELLSYT